MLSYPLTSNQSSPIVCTCIKSVQIRTSFMSRSVCLGSYHISYMQLGKTIQFVFDRINRQLTYVTKLTHLTGFTH
ncbi:hypothetical protein Hanom_Chr14g01327091 [Helianthus anomalus]